MKLLAVFLFAVLGRSLAEGREVGRCELRDRMVEMLNKLPDEVKQKGLTVDYLVAPAVCHVEKVSGFNSSAVNELIPDQYGDIRRGKRESPQQPEVWMLYGLFQLSNHLVCSDGLTSSPNICNLDCSALVDDDPHDDITCVLTIFTEIAQHGFSAEHLSELRRMITLIYQEDCNHTDASTYFAKCKGGV